MAIFVKAIQANGNGAGEPAFGRFTWETFPLSSEGLFAAVTCAAAFIKRPCGHYANYTLEGIEIEFAHTAYRLERSELFGMIERHNAGYYAGVFKDCEEIINKH